MNDNSTIAVNPTTDEDYNAQTFEQVKRKEFSEMRERASRLEAALAAAPEFVRNMTRKEAAVFEFWF